MSTTGRYTKVRVDGKVKDEHRVVWEKAHGPIPKGYDVHHKNGDGHDNRLSNLKLMTHSAHMKLHGYLREKGVDVVDTTDPDVIKAHEDAKRYQETHRAEIRARNARYRAEHKEQERSRKREYYEDHREERIAYTAKWRERNKEHVKAYTKEHHKKYYAENIDTIRAKKKKRYEENKEAILAKNKVYAAEHKEELKKYHSKYFEEHKEILSAQDKLSKARRKGASPEILAELEKAVIEAKAAFKRKINRTDHSAV